MYSDYALIKKSTLIEACDALRERTGNSDLIDPADFASKIREIEGGEGTSVLGGYTVKYYDLDGELIESRSTKYGMAIGSPVSFTAQRWTDENDNIIELPFTVTEDMDINIINLYSSNPGTYTDKLYSAFGINPEEYPVVFLKQYLRSGSGSYYGESAIYFAKSISGGGTTVISLESGLRATPYVYVSNVDIKELVDAFCETPSDPNFKLNSISSTAYNDSNFYVNNGMKLHSSSSSSYKTYDLNVLYGEGNVTI